MLIIHYNITDPVNELTEEHSLDWTVGKESPCNTVDDESANIKSILADGLELEHIKERFRNLPYAKGNDQGNGDSCIWRGEFARFIYDNL